jgi:exodeoxyribonuclease-3
MGEFRAVSWNVNGIRAVAKKGFLDWLAAENADVVGLQETRAELAQLDPALSAPNGWHFAIAPAEKKGYSGVGLYSRRAPDQLESSLGIPEFDAEGRLQIARFGSLTIANAYFPNGSGKNRDHSRIPYKLDFYRAVFDRLEPLRAAGKPVLVMGDFNTAHQPIDLARPKTNTATSGFTDVERDELDRWLKSGWTDTFRYFHDEPERYTWWSNRQGVRERNVGWRIDYVLASGGAMTFLREAFIQDEVWGSDHCPIGVVLDDGALVA